MTHKVYVPTDLGPGDGGKGGIVHKLATWLRAHTVLKKGGAQGSHGVCTSAGERFAFSQWGCGTFEGIRTHITSGFVASPEGLLNEAAALVEAGVRNPFDLLTVDERALCATPYHGIASRLKELARGINPRGTIGTGVGEAYRDAHRVPELAIFARDLSRTDLRDRLAAVRERIMADLAPVLEGDFLDGDRVAIDEEVGLLNDGRFLDFVVGRFKDVARLATIVGPEYLGRDILSRQGVAVVESSHGVLTDRFTGFHPHTSAIRTLPRFTRDLLEEAGYCGQVVNIGVHRAYTIRHGAGPMPTADATMAERLLPGSHKETNRYQGEVRVGPLDLPLLRYAIAASGGPSAFDGLAITWFDQIRVNGEWAVCDRYRSGADDPMFFARGELNVRRGEDEAQLAHLEALGNHVRACVPEIQRRLMPADATNDRLFDACAGLLNEQLGIPVRMVSLGPTERDKVAK